MPNKTNRILAFTRLYESYLTADVDQTISPSESMNDQWYMSVGQSAAQVVYAACVNSWLHGVKTVLDIPCGHGRVLRHLVKLFPDAAFDACDLDAEGVEFCARQFGARPIVSQEDLLQVEFPRRYDLIWVGSLFTHTSRPITRAWLAHLTRFLNASGIIVATLHGRYSLGKGAEFGYIDTDSWRKIEDGYRRTGYGYADYPQPAHGGMIKGSYGVSVSSPAAIMADALEIEGVRVFSYTERGWAGHQDVLVIGKPELMK